MSNVASGPVVIGRIARAEICACAGSIVLSLGGLSLRLERAAAEDVAVTLMRALAHEGGESQEDGFAPCHDHGILEGSN